MVKPEEAIAYLGYTEAQLAEFENIDALREDADKRFISRENALKDKDFLKAATGKLLGSIQTKFQATAKQYGIELLPDEIKDTTPEKLFELSLSKLSTASLAAQEELKKQIGAPPDAQMKELQEKYNKLNTTYVDTAKLLDTTNIDFTAYKEKSATEIRGAKLNFDRNQELKKIEPLFKPNINEVEKLGFQAAINSLAKFDYDDKGILIITDLSGSQIPSKITHGHFQKPEEFLKELGLKLGVIPVNQNSKQMPNKTFVAPVNNSNGADVIPLRKLNTFASEVNTR